MKNYLYLNAIVNGLFKDLPSQRKFLPNYEQALTKYRGNNASLLDPKISKAYSYFALRSKGNKPVMIFTKSERHSSRFTASEGAFVQHIGWEWYEQLMLKDINEIFEAEFYSEEQVVEMGKSGVIVDIPGGHLGTKKNPELSDIAITIHPDTKKAILSSVIMRWFWDWEPVVRVAVPDDVDYNSYVISAVKEIYKLFPVAMRTEVGFCSYVPDKENVIRRVYLGFVPASQGDEVCLYLDGSNHAANSRLTRSTNSEKLDKFIDFVANAPEELLPRFFEAVYKDIEAAYAENITTIEPSVYEALTLPMKVLGVSGTAGEQLDVWNGFYENQTAYSSNLRELIKARNKETVDVAAFCAHFKYLCAKTDDVSAQLHLFDFVCGNNLQLAEELRKAFVEVLRDKGCSEVEIYEKIYAERAELAIYFTKLDIDEARCGAVDERFVKLGAMPTATLDEIEVVWNAALQLLADVGGYEQTEAIAERKQDIDAFVKQFAEFRNDAKLKLGFAELEEIKGRSAATVAECEARKAEQQALRERVKKDNELTNAEGLLAALDEYIGALVDCKKLAYENDLIALQGGLTDTVEQCKQLQAKLQYLKDCIVADRDLANETELKQKLDTYGEVLAEQYNARKQDTYRAELAEMMAASAASVAECDARIAEQEALQGRIAADLELVAAEALLAEVEGYGVALKEKRNACKLADYEAELAELKKQPVEKEEDCRDRIAELKKLADCIVADKELSGSEDLKQAVIAFNAELKEKRSAYRLEAYEVELAELKTKQSDSVEECIKLLDEAAALHSRVAADKVTADKEALLQALNEYSDMLAAKRKALRTAQFEKANSKIDLRAVSTLADVEASVQTLQKLFALAEKDEWIDRDAVLGMLTEKQVALSAKEYMIYAESVQALLELSTDSMAEIQDCVQKAEALKREIVTREFAEKDKLVELLDELIKEKNEQSQNTGVLLAEAGAAISNVSGYFKRLQAYDACDKRFFDEAQLAQLMEMVKQQRPERFGDYRQAFEEQYGEAMTLTSVGKCSALICREIVKDVCDYRKIVVGYPYKMTAVDAVAVLGCANGLPLGSDGTEIFVKFGGSEYTEQWFRQMLSLSHTAETMGDPAVFADIFKKLMNDGAYTAADLVKCVAMLKNCKLDYKSVLTLISEAKISDGRREQYMLAYYAILELFGGNNREEVLAEMQKAYESMRGSMTARNALKAFIDLNTAEVKSTVEQNKADESAKGNPMVKTIVTAAVAVLLIVGAFVGGMFLGKGKAADAAAEAEPTPAPTPVVTVQPAETDAAAEYIEGMKLLYVNGGVDFDACSKQVQQSYADAGDELMMLLEQQYAENNEHTVQLASGKTVEWEEFFFWKCWILAGESAEVQLNAFQTTEYDSRVMAILNAIHGEESLTAGEETQHADEETRTADEKTQTADEGDIPS